MYNTIGRRQSLVSKNQRKNYRDKFNQWMIHELKSDTSNSKDCEELIERCNALYRDEELNKTLNLSGLTFKKLPVHQIIQIPYLKRIIISCDASYSDDDIRNLNEKEIEITNLNETVKKLPETTPDIEKSELASTRRDNLSSIGDESPVTQKVLDEKITNLAEVNDEITIASFLKELITKRGKESPGEISSEKTNKKLTKEELNKFEKIQGYFIVKLLTFLEYKQTTTEEDKNKMKSFLKSFGSKIYREEDDHYEIIFLNKFFHHFTELAYNIPSSEEKKNIAIDILLMLDSIHSNKNNEAFLGKVKKILSILEDEPRSDDYHNEHLIIFFKLKDLCIEKDSEQISKQDIKENFEYITSKIIFNSLIELADKISKETEEKYLEKFQSSPLDEENRLRLIEKHKNQILAKVFCQARDKIGHEVKHDIAYISPELDKTISTQYKQLFLFSEEIATELTKLQAEIKNSLETFISKKIATDVYDEKKDSKFTEITSQEFVQKSIEEIDKNSTKVSGKIHTDEHNPAKTEIIKQKDLNLKISKLSKLLTIKLKEMNRSVIDSKNKTRPSTKASVFSCFSVFSAPSCFAGKTH